MNKTLKIVSGFALAAALSVSSASAYTFNTNLSKGMTSPDVKALQQVLNMTATTQVAASGVGSAGYETSYFGNATRAAVMKFQAAHGIAQVGIVGPMTRSVLNGMNTTTPTTPTQTTGPVSVMLSTDNPASNTIVSGQATADLAHFTFSGTGTVSQIVLQRAGVSSSTTLSNVYLYANGTRLTDAATVNTNGVITFNNVNLMVSGSTSVAVRADIASGISGQTVGVTLTSYMLSGSTTAMTANLAGNLMAVSSGSGLLAGVVVCNGCSSPYNNTSAATINAGVTQYTVWSAPLQVNTRAVMLKSLALRYVGSASNDALANISLYLNGVKTGNSAMINGMGYVVFDLSAAPVTLNTGSTTVDIRADVVKGSNRNFSFSLQNAGDLMVTDSQLNVNVAPTTASTSTFSVSQAGTISVSTGSMTFTINPAFQTMTNVTGGSANTVIARYNVTAYGEDVKTQSLSVTPALSGMTPAASGLNNVALYYDGAQVGSSQNWTSGALTFQLGSSMIVTAGVAHTLEVRADLQTSSNSNYTAGTVTVTVNTGSSNGQGMSSLNTTNVPASSIATTGLSVQTGTLGSSKNTAYLNQTMNPNMSNAKIGSFVLQNQSTSESVRVTNLLASVALTTIDSTNLSNLKTSETTGSGATPINPVYAAAGFSSANNFSVNFTLAPGATKVIDVFADLGTAASGTMIVSLTPTAIGVSSNVNVTPSAAVGQTITLANGTFNTPTFTASASTTAQFVAAANGLTDGSIAEYNFTATSGVATISELKFSVTGTNTVASVRVGTVSAPVVSGIAYLTGLNLTVPNGGSGLNVDAYPTYSPVGTNGITSATTSLLTLTYVKYTIGGSTATITPSVAASTMTLMGTKPVVTVAKPSSILAVGNIAAIDVTVAANQAGDLKLNTLPVTVTMNNATVSTSANTIVVQLADGTAVTTTNTAFGAASGGSSTITFTSGYTITAGSSKTFRIFVPVATVTGTGVNGASMSTYLATGSNFSWTDTAGGSSSPITGTTLMVGYPTTTSAVIYN